MNFIPEGIFLIKWDEILGGSVYKRYPEDLEIPEPVVQQIQISHDFVESKITIQEKNWNSISYYNEKQNIITVLILDKYADSSDYFELIEDFNSKLDASLNDAQLDEYLKIIVETDVFRTRDEVISKLSNEVAQLKMWEYDVKTRIMYILKSKFFDVKSKLLFLFLVNNYQSFNEIKSNIKASDKWLETIIQKLMKRKILGFNKEKNAYFLII